MPKKFGNQNKRKGSKPPIMKALPNVRSVRLRLKRAAEACRLLQRQKYNRWKNQTAKGAGPSVPD
ncbi:hypothetical protein [Vibrio harveyi]|uniref:hypothetical protein n=1 Tax=Vibrio harveyi group TaxID=717610 RepID=UPI0023801EB2|nr:hypothetical protein [Vibrio harveyi]